jgi:hypothetical protein
MVPALKPTIEAAAEPMALWIELFDSLEEAYREGPPDDDLIGRLYQYTEWSLCAASGDVCTAVMVAFYEELPANEAVARDLPRWMTTPLFGELESPFRYLLSDEEYERFREGFLREREAIVRRGFPASGRAP